MSIPEKLYVTFRNSYEATLKPSKEKSRILPAFIVPANSEKFVATANGWRHRDIEPVTIENTPISGLRIIGLSRRSSGGRAYKVIYPPNYLTDLREDVLLDAIYNVGVDAGGKMNGEYIWSVNGSQMRLIRVGSEEYQNVVAKDQMVKLPRIPMKDLKEGTIYMSKGGSAAIFLGHISTISSTIIWDYNAPHRSSSFYNRRLSSVKTKKYKAMLWFKTYGNKSAEQTIEIFNNYINAGNENGYSGGYVSIDTSHSMRKVCGTTQLPENVIFLIREKCSQVILSELERRMNERGSRFSREDADITIANTLCHSSDRLNMVPYGQDPMEYLLPQMERIINL